MAKKAKGKKKAYCTITLECGGQTRKMELTKERFESLEDGLRDEIRYGTGCLIRADVYDTLFSGLVSGSFFVSFCVNETSEAEIQKALDGVKLEVDDLIIEEQ